MPRSGVRKRKPPKGPLVRFASARKKQRPTWRASRVRPRLLSKRNLKHTLPPNSQNGLAADARGCCAKFGPLTRARLGPLARARLGPLARAKLDPLARARLGPLTRARLGPLTRARLGPLARARLGHLNLRRRKPPATSGGTSRLQPQAAARGNSSAAGPRCCRHGQAGAGRPGRRYAQRA